ncbi:MAG: helix-turn-helix transcriptional regulator [bacterium]
MKSLAESVGMMAELGGRLRSLRRAAGLPLRELAHVMGRRPGFHLHLGRLERGRLRQFSLALLADYLRACGASFGELVPVLDRYTSRPPVRETRARETALAGLAGDKSREAARLNVYDLKTEAARKRAGQKPVAPARRAQALARQLAARHRYRAVDRAVTEELARSGSELSYVAQKVALSYGRMVWKAIEKAEEGISQEPRAESQKPKAKSQESKRVGRGRRRKSRAERLRDVEARVKALGPGILSDRVLVEVRDEVIRLYEEVRRFEG